MHEFDANGAAIGGPQNIHDLAQGSAFQAKHIVDKNQPIPIGIGKAIAFRIKLGMWCGRGQSKWVKISVQMAADPIRPN